jgi:hypothetical protein
MEVVQMAIHQVVNVIPVGYCLVAAGRPVDVRLLMSGAVVAWCASLRIHRVHLNTMVVHMVAVRIVQMAIVNIIGVAIVLYRCMPTARAVLVAVST